MDYTTFTMDQVEERLTAIEAELTAEGADLEALNAEMDALEARKTAIIAEAEQRKAELDAVAAPEITEPIQREDKKMENAEIRNSKAYIDAYAEYIKSGDDTECRALLTENGGGTVPVPELVYNITKTAWNREGLMSRVRKAYLRGNLKVGFEKEASGATVHSEGADLDPENLVLGTVELVPQSIKKWISVSDEALDLRGEAFLEYIYDELTYQIAKKAADELIGKILACTTVNRTTSVAVPAITQTSVALGSVAKAMAELSDEAANPVVIINKATWAAFKEAQYSANFAADPFEGLDVVFNNTLAPVSTATTGVCWMIVGDLDQGALANFPNGEEITLKFDDLSLAEKDLVKIVAREYVGLGVVAPKAFVRVNH